MELYDQDDELALVDLDNFVYAVELLANTDADGDWEIANEFANWLFGGAA